MEAMQTNRYLTTAWLYDFDQRDNLSADIPFYLDWAARTGGPVLELACGTGRVALRLAEAGYTVAGLDLSEPMLAQCRAKLAATAPEVRARVSLTHGDMAHFDLHQQFGLIIVPFRAFQALTEDADIAACLACVRAHLAPHGRFIVNVFRPYALLDQSWCYPRTLQWARTDEATGLHVAKYHWGPRIDTARQIIYPEFLYEATPPGGETTTHHEALSLRYYYEPQLRALLAQHGLRVEAAYGWYDESPIEHGRELILVCEAEA